MVVIVYNLGTNMIKLSFLLQYRRLFVGEKTLLVCKWALVLIGIWAVVQVLILALACLPLASIVPSMKGRCLPVDPVWYLSSAMNIVTDFGVFCIPIPSLLGLRTKDRKQKALLLVVFGLGFLYAFLPFKSSRSRMMPLTLRNRSTCIISIIRIFSLSKRTQSKDIYWTSVATACWSLVELHCGIICSCLATLRPLLRRVFPCMNDGGTSSGRGQQNTLSYEMRYPHSSLANRTIGGGTIISGDGHNGKHVNDDPSGSSSTEALASEFPLRADGAGQVTTISAGHNSRRHRNHKGDDDGASEMMDDDDISGAGAGGGAGAPLEVYVTRKVTIREKR